MRAMAYRRLAAPLAIAVGILSTEDMMCMTRSLSRHE